MIVDKLQGKDYGKLIAQWFLTTVIAGGFGWMNNMSLDTLVVYSLLVLLYIVCFAYGIERFYVYEDGGLDIHKGLARGVKWYAICILLCSLMQCLPYECHLYLVCSAILCSVLPAHLGMVQALLIVLTIQLGSGYNSYEILYGVMVVMLGMLSTTVLNKKQYANEAYLIVIGICCATYLLCQYAINGSITLPMCGMMVVEAILNWLLLLWAVPKLSYKKEELQTIDYGEAIEDDFPLVMTIRSTSERIYKHARLVSNLSFRCARLTGLDENLACCAGLYYVLCDSDVDKPVEYALELAEKYNLPVEVRRILNQYQGRGNGIITREAALVDLIDRVVSEFEKASPESCKGFDKQMIIIRTFDYLSGTGRYDHCGLGINMFLKARKFLIEEADFSDCILDE